MDNCAHEVQCATRIYVGSQVLHNVHKDGWFYICRNHGLSHHFYADDSQLYLSFKLTDNVTHMDTLCRVESCIVAWMHEKMLKLNTDKTEVIVFASQRNAKFVENVSVNVGESNIKALSCVKKPWCFP